MTAEIIVTDQQGERFQAEVEVYRVVSNPFKVVARIMRKNHVNHNGKITKRDWVHIHLDSEGIRALLDELGSAL